MQKVKMDYREDINNALKVLSKGGIILYPTDTVWGLGCDATNPEAVRKIYRIKERSERKSLIVLVNGPAMLERYVESIPEAAMSLIEVADKPLTVIYPAGRNLADGVCAKDGSAGIRICLESFCNELITRFRRPVVSTSANVSGMTLPATFHEIDSKITEAADYVVKYRQDDLSKNVPSPVIRFYREGNFTILRE